MTDWDPVAFENALVEDLRANGGLVTTGPMAGSRLLILNSTGAKTGAPRRSVLTFTRDGGDYVVAGTNNGDPNDPFWVANCGACAEVTIEADGRSMHATASVAESADREHLWAQHVSAIPSFAAYPEKSGRVIPMVRLTPKG
jgi:deazaflavin-dependent oxidoreductase (nitroreductase family)